MRMTLLIGMMLWVAASWAARGDQRTSQRTPPLVIESMTGRDSFAFYCATCHGPGGKGDGPTAAALKTEPSDLTLLSRRTGGTYPRSRIEAFVMGVGRAVPAHGSG